MSSQESASSANAPTSGSSGAPAGNDVGGLPETDRIIERGPGFRSSLRDLPGSLNVSSVGAGIVAAIFGCTGPALIIINGADAGGLSGAETASWLTAVYVIGGLLSLTMSLYYKQPITGAWSIPGAALVMAALGDFTLPEMVAAYLVAGILVLLLGFTGLVRSLVAWLPMPILMAMIGGVLFSFALDIVGAAQDAPFIVGAAIIGYLLLSRFVKMVPGVVGALLLGAIAAAVSGGFDTDTGAAMQLTAPGFVVPDFDWLAVLSVGVPLALVVQAENIQSMGVMMASGFRPPVNNITVVSGMASVLVSPFGGHNGSIAGPMTAICGSDQAGEKGNRYAASVVCGVLFAAFGLVAGVAVGVVTALPSELVATVAGLAMISVLLTAFSGAFGKGRFRIGALTTLVVAISDITLMSISSPFWALSAGVIASLILEPGDFRAQREEQQTGSKSA